MKRYPVIRPYDRKRKPVGFHMDDGKVMLAIVGIGIIFTAMVAGAEQRRAETGYYQSRWKLAPASSPRTPDPRKQKPADPPPVTARRLAAEAADAEGIERHLLHGLLRAENGGRLTADRSGKGAIGAAQLMPATARELGVDPRDARQNVRGGAIYLRRMIARYRSQTLGLVAYNMGPGATDRWLARGGHWHRLPRETRDYISRVNVHAALAARESQVAANAR